VVGDGVYLLESYDEREAGVRALEDVETCPDAIVRGTV